MTERHALILRHQKVPPGASPAHILRCDNGDVDLPGEDLVARGIEDLERGTESVPSLLVSIGAPRLRALGLEVGTTFSDPEHRLYGLL